MGGCDVAVARALRFGGCDSFVAVWYWLGGCARRVGGRDFAEGSEERFGFRLRTDGDAQEIGHGGERASDENIARVELFDDRFCVSAEVEHYEIGLRRAERAGVFGEFGAEPIARAIELRAAGGSVVVVPQTGKRGLER